MAKDCGSWAIEITNTAGIIYEYYGTLTYSSDTHVLSDKVRKALQMSDLYVFDGNSKASAPY